MKACVGRKRCGGRRGEANWSHCCYRQDLLDLLDQLTPKIHELALALEEIVEKRTVARRLRTHPGVGPLTALAFELVIGTPERFSYAKQIASYVGLVPAEESSGDRRRLGHISKQGNSLLRFLLVEAAQVTVRSHPQWHSQFSIWPCGAGERSRRSRWPGNLRCSCTGCGGEDGVTKKCKSSVRTLESPEIAMVCSNHRRNDWVFRSPFAGESKQ